MFNKHLSALNYKYLLIIIEREFSMSLSFLNFLQQRCSEFSHDCLFPAVCIATVLKDRESVFSLEQMTRFFVVKYNKDNAFLQGRAGTGSEAHCKKLEVPKINFS